MTSYITADDFRASHGRVDISSMTDDDLAFIVDAAKTMVDSHCGTTFSYRTVENEMRRWSGVGLRLRTYHGPVRVVSSLTILAGVSNGSRRSFLINTAQVEATSGHTLPTIFGDVIVNRAVNSIQGSSLLLAVGAIPLVAFNELDTIINYTVGYDDGTPQSDGLSIPVPQWLRDATRMIAIDIAGDLLNNDAGLTGLQEIRTADTTLRKPLHRGKEDLTIPLRAKMILDHHANVWLA